MDDQFAAFNQFTEVRRKELQDLASSTSGEQELGDIVGQAWVIADDMIKAGLLHDMREVGCQDRLDISEYDDAEVEKERIHSLAGAYGKLLDVFDRNIGRLAEYLRLSTASARRRCDYVLRLALLQRPLPYPLPPRLQATPQAAARGAKGSDATDVRIFVSAGLKF